METWQTTEITVYGTGEMDIVAKTSRNACSVLHIVLLQPRKFILHPPYMIVNYPWRRACSIGGMNFWSRR